MRDRLANILATLQNVETRGVSTDYLYLAKIELAHIIDELSMAPVESKKGTEKKSK